MIPHGTRSNWRVNPQPSTGPSAGRVSPDPEQHHPDLGTAGQPANPSVASSRSPSPGQSYSVPAILIPHTTPSPPPMPGGETPFGYLHPAARPGQYQTFNPGPAYPPRQASPTPPPQEFAPPQGFAQPAAFPQPEQAPFPLDRSLRMPPFDRAEAHNAFMPLLAPSRPHSPSNAYLPGANAEPHVEARHREMIDHNFATFAHHPAMPAGPAGRIELGRAHSEALLGFREQVWARGDLTLEYMQTYRVDNGRFTPVHPELVAGHVTEVAAPRGSYPPGTGLVIHSHPLQAVGRGTPSEPDMLRAYLDRTNALQHPESRVASHMLYDPVTDRAYMYDGSLDAHGHPHYYEAVLPPPPTPPVPSPLPVAQPAPRTLEQLQLPAWMQPGAGTPRIPSERQSTASAAPSAGPAPRTPRTPFPRTPQGPDPRSLSAMEGSPRPESPAFFFPPVPEQGSAQRPISIPGTPDRRPGSPMEAHPTAPQSPIWNEWIDFDKGDSK